MKTKILHPKAITGLIEKFVIMIHILKFQMLLAPSQLKVLMGYVPWLGLGETAAKRPEEIFAVLVHVDAARAMQDQLATDMLNAADAVHANEHDSRRLLHKTPELLPFVVVMADQEKWKHEDFLVQGTCELPPLTAQNKLDEVPAKAVRPDMQISRAVEAQLGGRLQNERNVADWRLYASLTGARIFLHMPEDRRKAILRGELQAGYAFVRQQLEESERATRQAAGRKNRKGKKPAKKASLQP